jgi:hypothetical protein
MQARGRLAPRLTSRPSPRPVRLAVSSSRMACSRRASLPRGGAGSPASRGSVRAANSTAAGAGGASSPENWVDVQGMLKQWNPLSGSPLLAWEGSSEDDDAHYSAIEAPAIQSWEDWSADGMRAPVRPQENDLKHVLTTRRS